MKDGSRARPALRDAQDRDDPRVGLSATFGTDWLPGVHAWQLQQLAEQRDPEATPG